MLYDAAAALATAMETATVVLPPIAERLSVPSTSHKTSSIVAISSASIPISSEAIMSSISLTITSTPPSGNDTTSLEPVLAPLGAAALPNPFQVITSTSTVGFLCCPKSYEPGHLLLHYPKKNTSVSINLLPYNLYS